MLISSPVLFTHVFFQSPSDASLGSLCLARLSVPHSSRLTSRTRIFESQSEVRTSSSWPWTRGGLRPAYVPRRHPTVVTADIAVVIISTSSHFIFDLCGPAVCRPTGQAQIPENQDGCLNSRWRGRPRGFTLEQGGTETRNEGRVESWGPGPRSQGENKNQVRRKRRRAQMVQTCEVVRPAVALLGRAAQT